MTEGNFTALFILFALIMAIVAIAVLPGVWGECRVDHGFFYCMALVSR